MTEGAIANDRDAVLLAPGNHGLLDPTLLQMIEHLVACEPALTGDALGLLEIGYVKIAHAPRSDFALALKAFEARYRLLQRMRTAPVEQVAVQPVGLQARE